MENKRKALGKGLEQLFNSENLNFDEIENEIVETANREEIMELKLVDLRKNPYQPRKVFDEETLNELAASIEENGVIQPIIVKKSIKGYEIIAGERRVRASKKIGLKTIPAIVKDFSDEQMMQIALLENLQRENLNAIEEAEAYKAMIDSLGITQESLSKKMGKSRSHVTNILGLLKLPLSIQELVLQNKISMGHARVLSKLDDFVKMEELAEKTMKEDLSVRILERLASKDNVLKKVKEPQKREFLYLEEKLKEVFGTKVMINKGKLQFSYETKQDLNRLLEIMGIKID